MIPRANRRRPGSCSKLCSSARDFLAQLLAPIEVEPAVGESFVVMFNKQFAPMRRENTIPRCRPQLVSSLARGMGVMAMRLPGGVAQRTTRTGEYVRAVVALRRVCAAGDVERRLPMEDAQHNGRLLHSRRRNRRASTG